MTRLINNPNEREEEKQQQQQRQHQPIEVNRKTNTHSLTHSVKPIFLSSMTNSVRLELFVFILWWLGWFVLPANIGCFDVCARCAHILSLTGVDYCHHLCGCYAIMRIA